MFRKGTRVLYIPTHVPLSDPTHPDVEHGVVTIEPHKDKIFIRFDGDPISKQCHVSNIREEQPIEN